MLPLTRDRNRGWKSVACAHSAILISVLLDVFGFFYRSVLTKSMGKMKSLIGRVEAKLLI